MINRKIIGLVIGCIAIGASAEVINFTGAEGYVNGNLNFGDNASVAGWTGGGSAYLVSDSTGTGKMTLSWPFANAATTLDKNLAVGEDGYSFRSDFSFSRVGGSNTGGGNVELFRQLFTTDHNSDHMYASLVQFNDNYKVVFQSNSGGISGQFLQSDVIDAASLGFGAGDNDSDALSLEFELTRGATQNDWDVQIALMNGASEVKSLSGVGRDGTAGFFTSDLDIGFHNTSAGKTGYVDGGFVFTSLEVGVIPEPASIGLISIAVAGIIFARRRFMI